MKTYNREELEQLASNNPQELALLFAQKVAGLVEPQIHKKDGRVTHLILDPEDEEQFGATSEVYAPDYLRDWTAVFSAGKRAGIEWYATTNEPYYLETGAHIGRSEARIKEAFSRCFQKPNWPDCAALMIVMIEVTQTQETST